MPESSFRVGVTCDIRTAHGSIDYSAEGLRLLEAAGIPWEYLAEDAPVISPSVARDYDALLVGAPQVTRETVAGADRRLALVARVGVGLDTVDVAACREHGVLVTTTPDAVRRPMASAALALILGLAHNITIKDALVRNGRWHDRFDYVGVGLAGRTLGLVGFGNIGREIARLVAPLDLRTIAFGPRLTAEQAAAGGVERAASLEALLADSDVVCLACGLTPETHHLIDADKLALMKESALLVNVGRGAVVDQRALADALRSGKLRGAGLDVFEVEPPPADDPLLALDNVILAPHALGHVDRLLADAYLSACESIVAVARGTVPQSVVR